MATYTTLRNGSRGDDVKKLQESLKAAGYNIGSAGVDGIYGNQTAAAVKAYQQANGLSVDGIAGNQTLGKLYGGSTPTATTAPTTPTTTPAASAKSYLDNESVTASKSKYDEIINNKPGEFTSDYTEAAKQAMEKYMNRDKFSYDLNGDALYQQYKDQYMTQGKLAMQDTMGQAAAMTGGYGNSYAQSVGQQTFQGYLQQLNDRVPELYQLALDQYNQEGENLLNQYGLLSSREETDYGRYRDTVSDWENEANRGYAEYRDATSDAQWEASYDEQVRQYEQEYKLKVEQIEEDKRHNRITEDQAQQQIDLAKQELRQSAANAAASREASYIQAGYTKDANGNWVAPAKTHELTKEEYEYFRNYVDDGNYKEADDHLSYLRSLGLSEDTFYEMYNSLPKWYRESKTTYGPVAIN